MTCDRDDEIGYRKPPKYTRFKKGKSGNPKGRPRMIKSAEVPLDTDLDDSLRKLNSRKLKIKLGGKEQEVRAIEAIALKQQAAAMGGSVPAMRDVMRTTEKLDARDALRRLAADRKAEKDAKCEEQNKVHLYDNLGRQYAEQVRVYKEAEATGRDPFPRYPLPEDFRFDHHKKRATIVGPWDEGHARHYLNLAKQRDFHLIDYIILLRQRPKGSKLALRLAAFQMNGFDLLLPKRQQIQGEGLETMLSLLSLLPMKDLREWRRELDLWLKLNPRPEPSKKVRREVYKEVNAIMKPVLKPLGFRSLAELENHCEEISLGE